MTVNHFELLFLTKYKTKDFFISHDRLIGKGFLGYKVHSAFKNQLEYSETDFAKLIEINEEVPSFDSLFDSIKTSYLPVIVTGYDLVHPAFPATYYFLTNRVLAFYEFVTYFNQINFSSLCFMSDRPRDLLDYTSLVNLFFVPKRPKMFYRQTTQFFNRFKRNYRYLIKPNKNILKNIDPVRMQNRHLIRYAPSIKFRSSIYLKYMKNLRKRRHRKILRSLRIQLRLLNLRSFRRRKKRIRLFLPRMRYELLLLLRFGRKNLLDFYKIFLKSYRSIREDFLIGILEQFSPIKKGKRHFLEVINDKFLDPSPTPFPLEKFAYSQDDFLTEMIDRDSHKYLRKYIKLNRREEIEEANIKRTEKYETVKPREKQFRIQLLNLLGSKATAKGIELDKIF